MQLTGYVKRLREDCKLDVTLRKVGAEGVADARNVILNVLAAQGGTSSCTTGEPPAAIQQALGIEQENL